MQRNILLLFFLFILGQFNFTAAQTITCSEINYNSHPTKASGNWIELHNYGSAPVNLGGYKLQEEGSLAAFTIPDNTQLAAGGYLVLSDDVTQFQGVYPSVSNVIGPTGITLGNNGDTLVLLNTNNTTVLRIGYLDAIPWPQCADGHGRTLENVLLNGTANLLSPTTWKDGCMFGSPGTAYTPCTEALFVNEINYRSSDFADAGDWIELWNRSGTDLNLSGWQVRDRNDTLRFTFPNGTAIKKDSFLVIYQDLFLFSDVHPGAAPNKVGPFQFGLSGNGDLVRLFDFNEDIVLSMFYNDAAPWPLEPDGQGPTLELRAPFTDLNQPANWASSCDYGTPGRKNSPCSSDANEQALAPNIVIAPNPAAQQFSVTLSEGQTAQAWQLTNVHGQVVQQANFTGPQSNWTITVQSLPAGVYLLKIQGDRWHTARQLIKS